MQIKNFILAVLCVFSSACTATAQTKISILGDSYSTFKGYVYPAINSSWYGIERNSRDKNDVSKVEETWWRLLAQKLDAEIEYNNSYSGATVCHLGYDKKDFADRSFVTRLQNLGDPDIILVLGGTNDAWTNAPLGDFQYDEWTHKDLFKFRPAFSFMLDQMKKLYPEARIYNISNCDLNKDYTESMAEICKHYGIVNIQLEKIDKQASHPSVKGMQMIADQVYERIK